MAILPLRCGNSNRSDLLQIGTSLLAQRGDVITTQAGSIIWIETQAHARAIYTIWCLFQKLYNQFIPGKMTDSISDWTKILSIVSLPTDTVQISNSKIAAKFALINKFPTMQAVSDLVYGTYGSLLLKIINTPASSAIVAFPNGVAITGGVQNVTNGPWFSDIQNISIETIHPSFMTDNQFYETVNQIYSLLNQYLPAYDTFDWFWDSFCDDGYASADGYVATISATVGETELIGVGTSWNTLINNADGTFNVVPGSILECYDDNGNWQRMVVAYVASDTSITLVEPALANITNMPYVIEGFFLDCDHSQFPYPPLNSHNLDNVGINAF